jgi:NAD(P)-dependent dehydrogenase (short-subunit alcohol dehydrogenase family)
MIERANRGRLLPASHAPGDGVFCEGRIAIVTGAGRGIGRAHALALAAAGASVVVNDVGTGLDGEGSSSGPAADVVAEIHAAGGRAVANAEDISDWSGSQRMIESAIAEFGGLDVLINNAGVLRDRMLVNMTEAEWDTVIRVHLRGTFATSRWAAAYWRGRAKAGQINDARIINTTSVTGLFGNPGQSNYGAAKAGIAALSLIAAEELAPYGVTVNAISPGARTRMTRGDAPAGAPGEEGAAEGFDVRDPTNVPPLVVWLASARSSGVTGRVFGVRGGSVSVVEGWHTGPMKDVGRRWTLQELDEAVPRLVADAVPNADIWGNIPAPADVDAGSTDGS